MTEFSIKGIFYDRETKARKISTEALKERLKKDCYGYNTAKDLRDSRFFYEYYYHFYFESTETTIEDIRKNIENGVVYFPFASSADVRTILLYLDNGFEVRFMTLKDCQKARKEMAQG